MTMGPTGEDHHGHRWAEWLREQLGSRKQRWLVDASDGAITPPRVSAWLRNQRPDPEAAVLVADLLRVSRSEALLAAGYPTLAGLKHPDPPPAADPMEAEIDGLELSDRAKAIILERREQNLRDLRALIAILRETEQPKDPANHAGGHGSD